MNRRPGCCDPELWYANKNGVASLRQTIDYVPEF